MRTHIESIRHFHLTAIDVNKKASKNLDEREAGYIFALVHFLSNQVSKPKDCNPLGFLAYYKTKLFGF